MADPQHLQWLRQGVDAWNSRRSCDDFKPDLSNADFSDADLQQANLSRANLSNTNFIGADLSHATLNGAILEGTDFERAWFNKTILTNANLSHAHLYGVDLSRARLFNTNQPVQQSLDRGNIDTIEELLATIRDLKTKHNSNTMFYFRGECEDQWQLRPSLMRHEGKYIPHESEMLRDFIARRPEDFSHSASALDQWVVAQHHKLKTRFLDILKNPLAALFFACKERGREVNTANGCLHIFVAEKSLVKSYTSDTVSILANFSKLSRLDQQILQGKMVSIFRSGQSLYGEAHGRLLQSIQSEKPYFADRIEPKDFFRVLIIEPQRSIERIRVQTGAFIVSAFHTRFERDEVLKLKPDTPIYAHYKLTVSNKHTLLEQLALVNITEETMFPGLDSTADAITDEYGGQPHRS